MESLILLLSHKYNEIQEKTQPCSHGSLLLVPTEQDE